MDDQTLSFAAIYDVFTLSPDELRAHVNILAPLYNVDPDDLYIELVAFQSNENGFTSFPMMAKFILTKLAEEDYPLLKFLTRIILILPFATAGFILSGLNPNIFGFENFLEKSLTRSAARSAS